VGADREFADKQLVLEHAFLKANQTLPTLRPKFRGQGSATYHTLNDPAHRPQQQVDFDDGMFLPVSFLTKPANSYAPTPALASSGYFRVVEAILAPLCKTKGWTLVTDKPSCVRVVLDSYSHLDIALYAIPDAQFAALAETAAARRGTTMVSESVDFADSEELYKRLSGDQIMLAHRVEGWIVSDPRKLEDWFNTAVNEHGYQLRRVCRYLKAWRDFTWKEPCRLTSITLMKCVVDAYDDVKGSVNQSRDDAALLEVARRLPGYFRDTAGIRNPVIDAVLNDNWTDEDRRKYVAAAEALERGVAAALRESPTEQKSLDRLEFLFGPRVPDDASLIVQSAEAAVKQFAPVRVPAPQVPRTTSG